MKFLIDRLAFRNALQRVEMGIDRKPTRPILGGVLIQAENHSVTLVATDLEIGIRYRMDEVQVDQPGWAVVPGRELVDVIKDTESETITLCIQSGDQCTVTAGEDECVLVTMESCIDGSSDPEAFGSLPVLEGEADVVLNKEDFLVMVGSTRFSTSRTHNMRFATEGVLVEVDGKRVTFVGTDGRRLACIHRDSIGGPGEKRRSVLLPKVLDLLVGFWMGNFRITRMSSRRGASMSSRLIGNHFQRNFALQVILLRIPRLWFVWLFRRISLR
jgi:DNA polymerase-3 subunit beta